MKAHWLTRQSTIRRLWIAFSIALVVVVLLDMMIERTAHFGLDGTFGFGAWFGFASCIALIMLAKAIGAVLKRPDRYYDR
jgi:hypothetical protein